MKLKIIAHSLPTPGPESKEPSRATTTLVNQKNREVIVQFFHFNLPATPLEIQVFVHQHLQKIRFPLHESTTRIFQKLWQPNMLWQSVDNTEIPERRLPESPELRKESRHWPATKTLGHLDWWNHIDPQETLTLLRLPAVRRLKRIGRPELYMVLVENGLCTKRIAEKIEELQLTNPVTEYFRDCNPFSERDTLVFDPDETFPLRTSVLNMEYLQTLLGEITEHDYKARPENRRQLNVIQQVLDIVLTRPNLIPLPERIPVLETIHETFIPERMGLYLADLPPSWFVHWQQTPPNDTLEKNWDMGDNAMNWAEDNPIQQKAVIELLRSGLLCINNTSAPSCINNHWLPQEWFEDTETIQKIWERVGAMKKDQLEDQILSNPDLVPRYLKLDNTFGETIRQKTAGKI
jgi:hypothetical protein